MGRNLNSDSQTGERYLRILPTELSGKVEQVDASGATSERGPPSFPAGPHPQSPVARSHPPGGCLSVPLMVCLVKTVGLAFFLA